MPDDTDELAAFAEPVPVGWPLVERRRNDRTPPGGVDRRGPIRGETPSAAPAPALRIAPIWPFRLAALVGAYVSAWDEFGRPRTIVVAAIVTAYNVVRCVRPVRQVDDRTTRVFLVVEQIVHTAAVLATGAWASPFALCLIPTGMAAAFACGGAFAAQTVAATVVVVTGWHVHEFGTEQAARDGGIWTALLALVVFTGGLTFRAARDAALDQQDANQRMARLVEANSLLFALQRVTQTMPASLDLDDVLDSTVRRVRTMIAHDAVVVYLLDGGGQHLRAFRSAGVEPSGALELRALPAGLRSAIESPRTVRIDDLPDGAAISPGARSGLYAALRARGTVVGLVAVESQRAAAFGQQQTEILHGLTEPFGVAIDNARMFRQIRTLAADEERARIARDLHDHIGSSLALAGFEIDRAMAVARDGGAVEPVLAELRTQVSAVVTDVRETLSDLRTDVTDEQDLGVTLVHHLDRVARRSHVGIRHDVRIGGRLPLGHERELWQIAREAITNVERHAQAHELFVGLRESSTSAALIVRDDGVGMAAHSARPDSFGVVGMRERAERIGAQLTIRSQPGRGTEVRVVIKAASG